MQILLPIKIPGTTLLILPGQLLRVNERERWTLVLMGDEKIGDEYKELQTPMFDGNSRSIPTAVQFLNFTFVNHVQS